MARLRIAFGTIARLPLPVLLAIFALFSLAIFGGWHDVHPNLQPAPVMHDTAGHAHADADHPGSGDPDFLDHVASHAGLHAIGLPAAPAATAPIFRPAMIWHAIDLTAMGSIISVQDLRPPRP